MTGRFSFAALALLLTMASPALAQEVGSQVDAICCGGTCCLIDGVCRTSGEANPDDACLTCDPSGSQTTWTDTCGTPDAGTTTPPADDGGCSAAGGGAYGFGLIGLALLLVRRRRR